MRRKFEDIVIQTVCRILAPFLQLFGLYIIIHGHYSPGGGFQGGCILGASFIMLAVAYDVGTVRRKMSEKANAVYCSAGVILFAGIGLFCLAAGGNYLDYGALSKILSLPPAEARKLGILGIEIGVGITVMAVTVSIFFDIISGGGHWRKEAG